MNTEETALLHRTYSIYQGTQDTPRRQMIYRRNHEQKRDSITIRQCTVRSVETKHIILNDGRTLAYTDCGDPEGIPVFHAHGGPGSRLEGHIFDATAKERGYRIITIDRPGMGESTYLEGRCLLIGHRLSPPFTSEPLPIDVRI